MHRDTLMCRNVPSCRGSQRRCCPLSGSFLQWLTTPSRIAYSPISFLRLPLGCASGSPLLTGNWGPPSNLRKMPPPTLKLTLNSFLPFQHLESEALPLLVAWVHFLSLFFRLGAETKVWIRNRERDGHSWAPDLPWTHHAGWRPVSHSGPHRDMVVPEASATAWIWYNIRRWKQTGWVFVLFPSGTSCLILSR